MTNERLILLGEQAGEAAAKIVAEPKTRLITADQLKQVTTEISYQRCQIMAGLINEMFPAYGITTTDQMHEILANLIQESGEFTLRLENMNYRAQTIVKVWPGRFYLGKPVPGKLDASKYARNPKALANVVYGGRMGNRPGTDDGWNLRGCSFVGLTGRAVLTPFAKYKGFATAEEAAEYARNSDRGAMDGGLWFCCVLKNLIDDAEHDDMIGIVREINGGTIGLKDRLFYYERLKKFVP